MVRNICDTAISPELDIFSRDNTNDGKGWNTRFHHYTSLGDHGYPRLYQNFADEAIKPLADYGGGSGTGALWLSEPGFPAGIPTRFSPATGPPATSTTIRGSAPGRASRWSRRSSNRCRTPSTSMWMATPASTSPTGVNGGYDFQGEGKPVGLIQQVIYPGWKLRRDSLTQEEADAELGTARPPPAPCSGLEAQREMLQARQEAGFCRQGFRASRRTAKRMSSTRAAAILTFKQLYGKAANKPLPELASDDAVREHVLRAMTDLRSELDGVPAKLYVEALKDKNPRVVLQALVGLHAST